MLGHKSTIICIHEDRPDCLTGVKVALLSLRRECPALPVAVSCPQASASFVKWLQGVPDVQLVSRTEDSASGWNAKPSVLLHLLSEGYNEVIWLDSDVVVHRNVFARLTEADREALVKEFPDQAAFINAEYRKEQINLRRSM